MNTPDPTVHVLAVRGARKQFGETIALDGLSLELRPGELLGLLGPNGAGKTTLVRAIAGRVRLDEGEINFNGASPPLAGGAPFLGVVPQELAVYGILNPRENLEVFGRLHGLTGSDLKRRVEWALEWTGLKDRAKDLVKTYSGGMKRRLNIACGVLHQPRMVLLDEPTVGVDPQSRERIYEMLAGLQKEGAALLLTTHHLEEAESRCERLVIIDHGRVVAEGTPRQLIDTTVGSRRKVVFRIDRIPTGPLPDLAVVAQTPAFASEIDDVAVGLPLLLQTIAAAGYRIEDITLTAPSLQSVFLTLTGRELRE